MRNILCDNGCGGYALFDLDADTPVEHPVYCKACQQSFDKAEAKAARAAKKQPKEPDAAEPLDAPAAADAG